MAAFRTIILLIISNIFMTFAWYGQVKLKQMSLLTESTPMMWIIFGSWGVALLEYLFMVPANHIGSQAFGGPFNLLQLKVMQEAISLIVFTGMLLTVFRGQSIHWNHLLAFVLIIVAVYLVFMEER